MSRTFGWDLPPGVRTCDLPGNSKEEGQWEEFDEWAMKQLTELSLCEAAMAVKIGVAAVKAIRDDITTIVKDSNAEAYHEGIAAERASQEPGA